MCCVLYVQVTCNSRGNNVLERCYVVASIFFPPRIWPFFFQCLSQSFRHFKVVLFVDIMGTW
jgi:hypothetical protein